MVYWQYFHLCALLGPVGWGLLLAPPRTDAAWFMLVCGAVSLYFSGKMIRLVLLLSPAAAVCAGVALGWILDQTAEAMLTDAEASAAAAARERAARAPPPPTRPRDGAPAEAQRELYEEVGDDLSLSLSLSLTLSLSLSLTLTLSLSLSLTLSLSLRLRPCRWRRTSCSRSRARGARTCTRAGGAAARPCYSSPCSSGCASCRTRGAWASSSPSRSSSSEGST